MDKGTAGQGLAGWDGRPLNAHVLVLGAWQQIQGVPRKGWSGIGVAGKTIQGSIEEKAQQQAPGKLHPFHINFGAKSKLTDYPHLVVKVLLHPSSSPLSLLPLFQNVLYIIFLYWTGLSAKDESLVRRHPQLVDDLHLMWRPPHLLPPPAPPSLLEIVLKTLAHLQ